MQTNEPDYKAIFIQIGDGIKTLAENTVSKYREDAIKEANAIVANIKDDLVKWTDLLSQGKIDTQDFEVLINSDKDLVKMKALEIAGLAQIRISQFKESVFNLIVDVIFKFILSKI